eukprot:scaffold32422_cov94-Isochrysis_galbana.AAC.4
MRGATKRAAVDGLRMERPASSGVERAKRCRTGADIRRRLRSICNLAGISSHPAAPLDTHTQPTMDFSADFAEGQSRELTILVNAPLYSASSRT